MMLTHIYITSMRLTHSYATRVRLSYYYTIGVRHTHIHISVTTMWLTHTYITSASTQSYAMSYHCEAHLQLCYGCGPTHIKFTTVRLTVMLLV